MQTLFYSPFAWLMLVLFGILVFGRFYDIFDLAVRSQEIGESVGSATRRLYTGHDLLQTGVLASILNELYLFFPMLTMGLICREINTGGIKLLDSSPVTIRQVVAGKYLSMCIFSLLLIVILLLTVVAGVFTVPHLEIPAILTALAGIYLLMCTYAAVGLFMSSLSSYPIVSAAGTLGVLAGLTYVGGIWQDVNFVREITWWLAINKRIGSFLAGIISSADAIYYLLVIGMCLLFTGFRLGFRKISLAVWKKAGVYAGVVLGMLALGYVTSRPALRMYADNTADQRNTISAASRQIMEDLEGRVTVTSYVNVLHKNAELMLPVSINQDRERFEPYMRFHPNMELEYLYYYGQPDLPGNFARHALSNGLTLDSMARHFCTVNGIDPGRLLTPEQVREHCPLNLAWEGNPVVRTIEAAGREPRPLRLYDDNRILPDEREIAVAFKGVTSAPPLVVYLTGRGMADITSGSMEGYDVLMNTPSVRMSLINQGFRVEQADITNGILSEGADLLVVANPTEELTPEELGMITGYLENGGNMLLLADAGNEQNMNKIAASLGISFALGYLVQNHSESMDLYPHIVLSRAVEGAARIDPAFRHWTEWGLSQPMRMATAIELPEREGYIPLFASSSHGWLKKEKANLLDGVLEPDASLGEYRGAHVTLAAIERRINGREQRILVSSDAEWLNNAGVATNYAGVDAATVSLGISCFSWLVDHKVPVQISRGKTRDGKINFVDADLGWLYYLYIWILPAIMAVAGGVLYYRRNSR